MIDFENKKVLKLTAEKPEKGFNAVEELLIDGETVIDSFVSVRDRLVFTDKRIISINVQGMTGMKKDYTSIPYKKIQTFSVETAGFLDLDAELSVYISSIGLIRFQLMGSKHIKLLCSSIAEHIL